MKKTPIKKIGRKRRERIANGGSESSLFLQILQKRGKTDLTGRPITVEDARSYQFAHILPKGMFPEYRLNPDNIIPRYKGKLCLDCTDAEVKKMKVKRINISQKKKPKSKGKTRS